jgi:hypothetical protein
MTRAKKGSGAGTHLLRHALLRRLPCRSARAVRRLGKGRSTGPTSGRAHLRGPHRLPGMCPSEPKQPKVFARRRWLALDYSGLREVLLERVTHPCTGSRVVYHNGITVKHSNLGLADCTSGLRTRRGISYLVEIENEPLAERWQSAPQVDVSRMAGNPPAGP